MSTNDKYNLVFVGAGNINFGTTEGPWNHSIRLEKKLGNRLNVVALIDPVKTVAEKQLEKKRSSNFASSYENTKIYPNLKSFVDDINEENYPKALIIGSPPAFRGNDQPGKDAELEILRLFPKNTPALFIEKPVTTHTVDGALKVAKILSDSPVKVSIGYFLRYLKVVQKAKQIIEEKRLMVMATNARYINSYVNIAKPAWWTKSKDSGPVVEQGTHFADLSRFFGGDVIEESIQGHALEWYEGPGKISKCPVDETIIAEDDRIPRISTATWKYKSGAVGTFTHGVVLHSDFFSTELEIYADGYLIKLSELYNSPKLSIISPGKNQPEIFTFPEDDPYFNELDAFISSTEKSEGNPALPIYSTFEDSAKTYSLTWAIRFATEKSLKTAKVNKTV